jgi:hypothetical protein
MLQIDLQFVVQLIQFENHLGFENLLSALFHHLHDVRGLLHQPVFQLLRRDFSPDVQFNVMILKCWPPVFGNLKVV